MKICKPGYVTFSFNGMKFLLFEESTSVPQLSFQIQNCAKSANSHK